MTLYKLLTFLFRYHYDSHILPVFDLFVSSGAIICSTIAFPPLRNSYYAVVWVLLPVHPEIGCPVSSNSL